MDATVTAAVLQAASAAAINKANISAQNKINDSQINLANTQHQREVADLRLAGLNPILSATGGNGAAVPNLDAYRQNNPLEGVADSVSSGRVVRKQEQLADMQMKLLDIQREGEIYDVLGRQSDLDIKLASNANELLRQLAFNEAVTGRRSDKVYDMIGRGEDADWDTYIDLVHSFKNQVESGRYDNSLERHIYEDALDGVTTGVNAYGTIKGASHSSKSLDLRRQEHLERSLHNSEMLELQRERLKKHR